MISDNVIIVTIVVTIVVTTVVTTTVITAVVIATVDQNAGVFVTRNRGSPV